MNAQATAAQTRSSSGVPVPLGSVRVAPAMCVPSLLEELGVDPAPVLAEFGLHPRLFAQPDNLLPFVVRCRLLTRCAEVTGRADFGLLAGQRGGMSVLGAVGHLAQSAPDLRTALELVMRHFRLHNPNGTVELEPLGAACKIAHTIVGHGGEDLEQTLDLAIATMFVIMRAFCGQHWRPMEVRIAHRRPRNVAPFRRYFGAPIVFDATDTSLVFASDWLEQPLATADPLLHDMMQRHVDELERLSREDVEGRLRRMLPELVAERRDSIRDAAAALGLGQRTLNRRLEAAGTSYLTLRDEVRYATARQLLLNTALPVREVGARVGYAHASAFTAAFRRWSGRSPVEWRAGPREDVRA